MLKRMVLGLFVLTITACSGGGGNDSDSATSPTDPNKSFSLAKFQSTTVGTVYSTQLTGSDSNNTTFTGTLSLAIREKTLLDGVLVTPRDTFISLRGGGTSSTVSGTSFTDASGNLISVVVQETGLICTPVSPDHMPDSVKIGDFDTLSTTVCNDNTTMESNWRVDDAGNGNIFLVVNGTQINYYGEIETVSETTYTIDENGNIMAFKAVSTLPSRGYTLSYKSV